MAMFFKTIFSTYTIYNNKNLNNVNIIFIVFLGLFGYIIKMIKYYKLIKPDVGVEGECDLLYRHHSDENTHLEYRFRSSNYWYKSRHPVTSLHKFEEITEEDLFLDIL